MNRDRRPRPVTQRRAGHSMDQASHPHAGDAPAVAPVKDPVCGMTRTPGKAKGGSATHDGHEYWFCNPRCREKFIADPETYLAAARQRAAAPAPAAPPPPAAVVRTGTTYTCPMHPEIRQSGPGDCPDCGMALEPDVPALRTAYVCPMHPEVVKPDPGSCPICGMALEPRTAS